LGEMTSHPRTPIYKKKCTRNREKKKVCFLLIRLTPPGHTPTGCARSVNLFSSSKRGGNTLLVQIRNRRSPKCPPPMKKNKSFTHTQPPRRRRRFFCMFQEGLRKLITLKKRNRLPRRFFFLSFEWTHNYFIEPFFSFFYTFDHTQNNFFEVPPISFCVRRKRIIQIFLKNKKNLTLSHPPPFFF
jgi:hypothetical protein